MKEYAFVLGNHAKIAMAELEAVVKTLQLPVESIERQQGVAFVQAEGELDVDMLMKRLGGTVKIVEVVGVFDEETVVDWLLEQIDRSSKFHFGFSVYAVSEGVSVKRHWKQIHQLGLAIKRALKSDGISCRYVQSKEIVLSSVIVHKERLLKNGVEIVLFKGRDGLRFGRTLAVQPFQQYSRRDYGRPQVDARSGMLPPKLAQMMVNISGAQSDELLLDPFCGSGTVLQEALLIGLQRVRGSDMSDKAVTDTEANITWLRKDRDLPPVELAVMPAQDILKKGFVDAGAVDRIVFEGTLGEPNPSARQIPGLLKKLQSLYQEVFPVLAQALSEQGKIVAALPFWSVPHDGKYIQHHLDMQRIADATPLRISQELLHYRRPESRVGRELLILSR